MKTFQNFYIYLMATLTLLVSADPLEHSSCYSNPGSLKNQGTYLDQSWDDCFDLCERQDADAFAVHAGTECWCGNSLPDAKYRIPSHKCNIDCPGGPFSKCGGKDSWNIFPLHRVPHVASTSSSSTSTASKSSLPSTTRSTSAAVSESTSQSASPSAASPSTSNSAATRRFKPPFIF
ncbi:WSC domain-containing protein [Aspergillus tanneri]|uniref:WSC domain-containing protein n=1 Tax=Aspergillus tanneri TaxID=1220188 RepID=A0A5M9M6X2_9EURO|nr:uncharacterized protein ATNIH1004_011436 [Aspergillus tanneri]KAA8642491.1 hypothetical protein ATNIH1004_011436 [Aspergillus tanneri]